MRTVSRLTLVLAVLGMLPGCTPGIRPKPPMITCSPVAQGKIVHLFDVEDWRKDGLGPRELGKAITLDKDLDISMLVRSSLVSSLDCMGFRPAPEGPGVPELRVAVMAAESTPGAQAQAMPPAPSPQPYYPQPQPSPQPGYPQPQPAPQPAPQPYYPQPQPSPQPSPQPVYPQPQPSPAASMDPAVYYPMLADAGYTPAVYQVEPTEETFYPQPVPGAEPAPMPAPVATPMAVSPYGAQPASLTMTVRVAFFYPPGTQMFSRDLVVTKQGLSKPADESSEAAMQQYNEALAAMTTNALTELGNQIVMLFMEHAELMLNLPSAPPEAVQPQPVYPQPQPQPQPVYPQPQPMPPPGPVLPPTLTPQMKTELYDMFEANMQNAMECLANADLGIPATVGIEVNPDGTMKNWGCKEEGLKGEPPCKCIVAPIMEQTFWPTQEGFKYIHVYK